MAGHPGNHYRPTAGPLKGQSVYLSKAQQAGFSRAAVLAALQSPSGGGYAGSIQKAANTQRPAASSRAGGQPTARGAQALRANAIQQTGNRAVVPHNGGFRVLDTTTNTFVGRAYKTQANALKALAPQTPKTPKVAKTPKAAKAPKQIGTTKAGYPKYANTSFPVPSPRSANGKPKVVIMAGLPASGKSTVRSEILKQNPGWQVIDADEIKKTIPGYNPKNPSAVHSQSVAEAFRQVDAARQSGTPFIWDVTGVNPQLPSVMQHLRQAGFDVEVLHVDVKEATARSRNAARARTVPDHVITNTASMLPGALQTLKQHATSVLAVDNN